MLRKPQPSLFSLQHDTSPYSKTLLKGKKNIIKEPRFQKERNYDSSDTQGFQGRQVAESLKQPTQRSHFVSKRESSSLNRSDNYSVSRSHEWRSSLNMSQKQSFFTPRINKESPFVDPSSVAQQYEGPLRYGKFLVRVFDGNLRQIRPKSACRFQSNHPRTFKARKSVMLSKPLSLTSSRITEHRKSLRSEDLSFEALKQLSSEPKYPPIQNKNTSFTDLFHSFMKKMEKIDTHSEQRKVQLTPKSKMSLITKNQSISNRGASSFNASIDSTKVSVTSRVCPPNSETISNEGIESGRGRLNTPPRQKNPLMQKSRIEYSFRKAVKSQFKQIIKNSPLLASAQKKKKPTHRRIKSNGNDGPPRIVIIGSKANKGGEIKPILVSPKTENLPRFSAQERRKIQQIIKIGKNCEVDLSKVNLSKRQKPYELAKSLEREIRQKADIHKPNVREELASLNRVCLTLSDQSESDQVHSPVHSPTKWRTITFSSNDSDLDDFFERELLY